MRRTRQLVVTLLTVAMVAVWAAPTTASADELFWRINEARAERGLAPLARFPSGSQVVAANDAYASSGEPHGISSQNMDHYASHGASAYAENQGTGPAGLSPQRMVDAWVGSPDHASNLFSSSATHLAVATTTTSGATFYTAHMITAPSVDASDPGPQAPTEPTDPPAGENEDEGAAEDGATGQQDEATTDQAPEEPPTDEPEPEPATTWRPEAIGRDLLAAINERDMAIAEVQGATTRADRLSSPSTDAQTGADGRTEPDTHAEPDARTEPDGRTEPDTRTAPDTQARADPEASTGTDAPAGAGTDPALEASLAGDARPERGLTIPTLLALTIGVAAGAVALGHRWRQERLRRVIRPRSRTPRGRSRPRSGMNAETPTASTGEAAPTSAPTTAPDEHPWTRR